MMAKEAKKKNMLCGSIWLATFGYMKGTILGGKITIKPNFPMKLYLFLFSFISNVRGLTSQFKQNNIHHFLSPKLKDGYITMKQTHSVEENTYSVISLIIHLYFFIQFKNRRAVIKYRK